MNDLPFFPIGSMAGDTGRDGVSPTITVTDITSGHRLTIVDTTGTKTVDILDGQIGPAGEQGPEGRQGIQGPKGDTGNTGPQGEKGDTGSQGPQGPQGIPGEQGPTGETGPAGKDGKDGTNGKDGLGIKSITINAIGELVIIYTDDNEANLGKVVGDAGIQGPQGETGPKGDTGEAGPAYVLTDDDRAAIVAAVLAEINPQV